MLTARVGLWFFSSIWAERPLTYQFTRPMLEGRFQYGPSWELLWEREPGFRQTWRMSSLIWAVALLIDAVRRMVMA